MSNAASLAQNESISLPQVAFDTRITSLFGIR